MGFVFDTVYVVNYVYRLGYVEPALHPQDESYLIMMDKFFDFGFFDLLLQSACLYFIEDFCIYVHYGYWPEVFFSCWDSAGFWYQDDVGLKMIWEGFPLFGLFGIVSEGMVPAPLCVVW